MMRARFFHVRALQTAARELGVSIMSAAIPRRYHWYLPQLYSNHHFHRRCIEPVKIDGDMFERQWCGR